MRELSEQEQQFIQDSLPSQDMSWNRDSQQVESHPRPKKEHATPQKRSHSRLAFWHWAPGIWGTIVLALPFLFWITLKIIFAQVNSKLGPGVLEFLSHKTMTSQVKAAAKEAGFDWLPQVVKLYSMHSTLILVAFAVAVPIAALLFTIGIVREKKRNRNIREDAVSQQLDRDARIADAVSELTHTYSSDESDEEYDE